MREQYIKIHNLSVAKELADFVKNELLLDTNVYPEEFWKGFEVTLEKAKEEERIAIEKNNAKENEYTISNKNKKLLEVRETLQQEIDLWHKKNRGQELDYNKYKNFLEEIGYLKKEGDD